MHSSVNLIDRKILHILTCVRLYLDSLCSHYRQIMEREDISPIKKLLAERYDESYEYRVMEAVRNYVQHAALPVTSASFGSRWNDERTLRLESIEMKLNIKEIVSDKFKRKILVEIERSGGSVDLIDSTRDYFSQICELHIRFRDAISRPKTKAEEDIASVQSTWLSEFP